MPGRQPQLRCPSATATNSESLWAKTARLARSTTSQLLDRQLILSSALTALLAQREWSWALWDLTLSRSRFLLTLWSRWNIFTLLLMWSNYLTSKACMAAQKVWTSSVSVPWWAKARWRKTLQEHSSCFRSHWRSTRRTRQLTTALVWCTCLDLCPM